jgi:hypothetical protein
MINDFSLWLIDGVAIDQEKYNRIAIWREPIMTCAPADDRCLQLREITVQRRFAPNVRWVCPCSANIAVAHQLVVKETGQAAV